MVQAHQVWWNWEERYGEKGGSPWHSRLLRTCSRRLSKQERWVGEVSNIFLKSLCVITSLVGTCFLIYLFIFIIFSIYFFFFTWVYLFASQTLSPNPDSHLRETLAFSFFCERTPWSSPPPPRSPSPQVLSFLENGFHSQTTVVAPPPPISILQLLGGAHIWRLTCMSIENGQGASNQALYVPPARICALILGSRIQCIKLQGI